MVKLERFCKEDFTRLINWIETEESMIQFSGSIFTFPITIGQLENYIYANNRLVFKVIDTDTGNVIGHAELNNINHIHSNASICRVLIGDKINRSKGFGKLIIKELVRYGFEELNLHRIDLRVFDFNQQAIKCYTDCGFKIEGLLRDTIKTPDGYWSVYNMSILNTE